jgi:glutaminyl-tRNA synthetase
MADKNFLTDIIDADLAEGKVREIHTRFPPEPNGYLHIGSAKAIYINWSIANQYGGKFNLRLDDTNPAREGEEYVESIRADLAWLGAEPNGGVFFGSDYFEQCYEYAEKLILAGKAYVDDLTREEMRDYRGTDAGVPSRPSPWRDRTPEENLALFRRMRAGEFADGEKTLRAKIDLASPNMNLRDPAIYRIKHVEHHRQGDKWCIYPMYDYAHPLQDAIEGITHSLCSLEFENHRPLYEWVIANTVGGEFPKQREFARLNVTNTVMSKRYLRELVEKGIVDGWDDPRMPTLCGLRRRGYTPSSIFTFVREAGISKADNLIDMRQLEACIRAELDLAAQRRVAVLQPVKLILDNYPAGKTETFALPNNPNREAADDSTRPVAFARELWIEAEDFAEVPPPKFKRLTPGGEVRLMGAYLVRCTGVDKNADGSVAAIHAEADLETGSGSPADGRKVRGTIHWVSCEACADAQINLYDNLFTEANMNGIPEGSDFKDYLNPDSVRVLRGCKLEASLAGAKPGERFQFVREGFFTPDSKNPGVYNRIVTLKDSFRPAVQNQNG